jgi:hypothetical protein
MCDLFWSRQGGAPTLFPSQEVELPSADLLQKLRREIAEMEDGIPGLMPMKKCVNPVYSVSIGLDEICTQLFGGKK